MPTDGKKSGAAKSAPAQVERTHSDGSKVKKSRKGIGGRPSTYSPEVAQRLCHAIATNRKSIAEICKLDPEFPSPPALFSWLVKHEEFANWYARAKQQQISIIGEEILDIVDNEAEDMIELEVVDKKSGELRTITQPNFTKVHRDKLRVETRKWLMAKLMPKLYGEGMKKDDDDTQPDKVLIEGGLPESGS